MYRLYKPEGFGRLVVVAQLRDAQIGALYSVDDAMLIIDASRPVSGERMPEALGLPNSREWVPLDFVDQRVDALHYLAIGLLPVQVVLPRMLGEHDPHSSSTLSVPSPLSSSAIASRSRRALLGLLSR